MSPLPVISLIAASGLAAVLWLAPQPEGMVQVPEGPAILGAEAVTGLAGPRAYDVAGFWIDRFEVTNAEYSEFVAAAGRPPAEFSEESDLFAPDQPVTGVRWTDAQAYCAWAGKRLPTELEWEKAARGKQGQLYPWGAALDVKLAHLDGDVPLGVGAHPTDESPYGVRGMAGNVSEWVADTDSARGGVCGEPLHGRSETGGNGVTLVDLLELYGDTPLGICNHRRYPGEPGPN